MKHTEENVMQEQGFSSKFKFSGYEVSVYTIEINEFCRHVNKKCSQSVCSRDLAVKGEQTKVNL